jgi:hypothetical protein
MWFGNPSWLAYLISEHYSYFNRLETESLSFPILYDPHNQEFQHQLLKFQTWIFSEISKKSILQTATTKIPFSLNAFKYINGATSDEIDYSELDDKALEVFSDVMFRLLGAIFIDSKDFATLS